MDSEIINKIHREDILRLENELSQIDGVKFGDSDLVPVTHHFAPGSYAREMFIPKGTLLVSKIHRHAHHSFLMKGDITVISETGGIQRLKAPMIILSKPGAKRIGYAHEDTIWTTVHPTNETDLEKIEEDVIVPSYEQFELESGLVYEVIDNESNIIKLLEVINEEK